MIPLARANKTAWPGIRGVFTDIDDTLSTCGKLTSEAYQALWALKSAGINVVVVTGRPAGWCDHIARFWPVKGVIGENGGFYFRHDGARLIRRFIYSDAERSVFREQLQKVSERILAEVQGCALASDQSYRECDCAIDYCEDVPRLPRSDALRIKTLFEEAGAHAKISSIHVNGWYGDFNKLSTARLFAQECLDMNLDADNESFIFCGDSPNDEPMFAFFKHSVGMANFARFADLVTHPPAYITEQPCGAGFCEVAHFLLAANGCKILK